MKAERPDPRESTINAAAELLELHDVTENDLRRVREAGPILMPELERITKEFYDWIRRTPKCAAFFRDEETIARVRDVQTRSWVQLFEARFDQKFIQQRRRIGQVHAAIGLPASIYLAANSRMCTMFCAVLASKDLHDTTVSLSKIMQADAAIILGEFVARTNAKIEEQSRAMITMSTPLTNIWDGILLLPVVGVIDTRRAQDIMTHILERIARDQCAVAILDISGVPVVDTAVANHLIKLAQAARLMGCHCTISGISPSIARTMVELGIEVEAMHTTGALKDALLESFGRINLEVRSKS